MAPNQKIKSSRGRQRKDCAFGDYDRELKRIQAIDYLIRLDMLPPFCIRQKQRFHDVWLGLALFLPSYLFVIWKLLTA